jgi:hypothetical protein
MLTRKLRANDLLLVAVALLAVVALVEIGILIALLFERM